LADSITVNRWIPHYFYAWSVTQLELIEKHVIAKQSYDISIEKLIQQGLQYLLEANEVIQIAPAGHLFKHPSGTRSKVFIQAREMARSEPELFFVANAICLRNGKALQDAEIVFIDTMGIYHYVREALKAVGNQARIESFHSYGEMKKLSPPIDSYLCVISASTSGGMAGELVNKQGFDPNKVVTLIDVTEKNRCGSVLMPLDTLGEGYAGLLEKGMGTETEIELVGEHFSSKAKPPRTVALGVPHQPKLLGEFLKHFALLGVGKLNSNFGDGPANPKLLCLDASSLTNNSEFTQWLDEEIAWCITLAVDHVIHASDPISKMIAELAATRIQAFRQTTITPSVISHDDLCKESLENAKGILVVTAVAGDGGGLREISRDLREYVRTETPRHFLAAVGLPQTAESWARLKQFLERNPTKRKYGFSNWLMLPVGYDGKDSAWEQLNKLAKKAEGGETAAVEGIDQEIVNESLEQLAQLVFKSHQGFLPKHNGGELALTEGFVFFGGRFETEIQEMKIASSVVYLAIASALQCARELKDVNNQLKSTGYESVVLAPECFLRFNDNILQACLLRACHSSELDYSASPHLSKLMQEFLTKVFDRHSHTYGDAALEFAAALAIGRLKLKKDDLDDVIKFAIARLKHQASPLLGFLLLAKR